MQPQKVKFKIVQINMKQVSYMGTIFTLNIYTYLFISNSLSMEEHPVENLKVYSLSLYTPFI